MDLFRRAPLVVAGFSLIAASLAFAGQDKVVISPRLTSAEMETFLLKARIIDARDAGAGVTGSQRVKLTDGRVTHDAHVQTVDIAKPLFSAGEHSEVNFKDTYRFNIAGYRLARLLGIDTVPMSVERTVKGKTAAVTWWVDDVQMNEKERLAKKSMGPNPLRTSNQIQLMHIWDELIQNRDRNAGNIIWTSDWTMWLIDHTRAFRLGRDLQTPGGLTRIERSLFEKLRALDRQAFTESVGKSLTKDEVEALFVRREKIVKLFDEKIKVLGEDKVLFTIR